MKSFIVLVIVCGVIGLSKAIKPSDEAMEVYKKMGEECAAKEGASSSDVTDALQMKLPSTKPGKCLHACLAETIGVMKNNKLDVEASVAMAKAAFGDDPERLKIARAVATECASETDADRCEAAGKMVACTDRSVRKHGLNFE